MTVNAVTDTKKGRTGIAPTYLHVPPVSYCYDLRRVLVELPDDVVKRLLLRIA